MPQGPADVCTAYQKNGLTIMMQCVRDPNNPAVVKLNTKFTNTTPQPMNKFAFQAAAPKEMQLKLNAASGNVVPANGADSVKQVILISNPQGKPMRLMMKIQFEHNGQMVQDQAVADKFP